MVITHLANILSDIAHINKMGWYVPAAQDFSPIKNNEWPTHWKNFSAISPFLSSYHNTQWIVPILQSDLCKFCRDSKRYILSLGWAFHLIWSLCYKPWKYQIVSTLHDTPCFPQEILKTDNIFPLIQAKQFPSSNLNPKKMGFSGEVFQWTSKPETKMPIKKKGHSELSALPKFKQI